MEQWKLTLSILTQELAEVIMKIESVLLWTSKNKENELNFLPSMMDMAETTAAIT